MKRKPRFACKENPNANRHKEELDGFCPFRCPYPEHCPLSCGADYHHDRHPKHRKSQNGHKKLNRMQYLMLGVILKPTKDSLKSLQSATKSNIKSEREQAAVMKRELVTIGQFIDSLNSDGILNREEASLFRKKCW